MQSVKTKNFYFIEQSKKQNQKTPPPPNTYHLQKDHIFPELFDNKSFL